MSAIPAGAGQLLGKRLGKYEILALLALGGTAEIYLARIGGAAGFEKYVVVKCLHDHLADDTEFVRMFLDEARLAAHLDHSNIVQTMELGQYDGRYYMVMEFLAGLSLAMIIRRVAERLSGLRIPAPLVLNMLAQASAGLHYAHEKAMNGKPLNIVHRDISPQNLVISFEGVVKLVDFGIAKAELRETHTRSGTIKGKFAYMSPEQCVANNVDRRTDVFALGVIGHELLTGRRLFKRPSPYETYQAVLECDVKPPSMIEPNSDPALDPVILRALTKDKEDRYPTAEAFGDALLGYLHHRGIGSRPADVAAFFEAHFRQELDEHSGRMRELIAGRDVSIDAGVTWSVDDPDEDAKRERAADSARRAAVQGDNGLGDISSFELRRSSLLPSVLDGLGTGSRVEDDDEMPAERTRIESNPLERVNELERLAASTAKPRRSSKVAAPRLPTPPPSLTPSSMPAAAATRFADPANVPTMIAETDQPIGVPPALSTFANAPTALAPGASAYASPAPAGTVPPAASSFGNAPTALAPGAPAHANSPHAVGTAPPPPSRFANDPTLPPGTMSPVARFANAHTVLAPSPPPPQPGPTRAPDHHAAHGSPPGVNVPGYPPGEPNGRAPGPVLAGYPVMNAELSAQMEAGATVFPSDARSGSGPIGAGPMQRDMAMDPQRAASLMSPVGQHYPDNVDWEAAAAAEARAVPTWLLAIFFIGALGVALAITIAIARLVS
jgi:eukaryotic-like serine/threonine-protein kinase